MADNFESQKNFKATGYTALACGLLLGIFFIVSWTRPVEPPPPLQEGLEVNLGNSDQGLGKKQPYLPGESSAQEKEKYTPPKPAPVEKAPAKDVETDDNNKEDAPVVKKAAVTKPNATRIPEKDETKSRARPAKTPDPIPTPVKQRPKAVFSGVKGNGTGGNGADDFKPGGNEGVAGGRGDQGAPGGNPNSTNYAGGGSGNGVAISRGLAGRGIVGRPSFTDDFNENAKVAVDIHIDAAGNVTDADYQPRGSTTADASMKAIALRKAHQVKFNAGDAESVGTIIFTFKVHD